MDEDEIMELILELRDEGALEMGPGDEAFIRGYIAKTMRDREVALVGKRSTAHEHVDVNPEESSKEPEQSGEEVVIEIVIDHVAAVLKQRGIELTDTDAGPYHVHAKLTGEGYLNDSANSDIPLPVTATIIWDMRTRALPPTFYLDTQTTSDLFLLFDANSDGSGGPRLYGMSSAQARSILASLKATGTADTPGVFCASGGGGVLRLIIEDTTALQIKDLLSVPKPSSAVNMDPIIGATIRLLRDMGAKLENVTVPPSDLFATATLKGSGAITDRGEGWWRLDVNGLSAVIYRDAAPTPFEPPRFLVDVTRSEEIILMLGRTRGGLKGAERLYVMSMRRARRIYNNAGIGGNRTYTDLTAHASAAGILDVVVTGPELEVGNAIAVPTGIK